jgi:hypothetical protein
MKRLLPIITIALAATATLAPLGGAAPAATARKAVIHCHRGYVRHGHKCVKVRPKAPPCGESCQQERRIARQRAAELAELINRNSAPYVQTPEWLAYAAASHPVASEGESPFVHFPPQPVSPPPPPRQPEAPRPPEGAANRETVTSVSATAVVCELNDRLSAAELAAILAPKLAPINAKLAAATKDARERLAVIHNEEMAMVWALARKVLPTVDELRAIEHEVAEELPPFAGDGFKLAREPFEAIVASAEATANAERQGAQLEAEAALRERVAHEEESCAPQFPVRPIVSVTWRESGKPVADAEVGWAVLLDGKPSAAWTVAEVKAGRVEAQATFLTLNPFVWGESSAVVSVVMA